MESKYPECDYRAIFGHVMLNLKAMHTHTHAHANKRALLRALHRKKTNIGSVHSPIDVARAVRRRNLQISPLPTLVQFERQKGWRSFFVAKSNVVVQAMAIECTGERHREAKTFKNGKRCESTGRLLLLLLLRAVSPVGGVPIILSELWDRLLPARLSALFVLHR